MSADPSSPSPPRRQRLSQKARYRLAFATFGLIVIASVAHADAPMNQYGTFDQMNVMIFDNYTHLTWERYPTTTLLTFSDAMTYCQNLSLGSWSTGWRAPSYKELLSIEDDEPHAEYQAGTEVFHYLDSHAFLGAPVDQPYWSSSVFPGSGGTRAFRVDFLSGEGHADDATATTGHIRCVHDPDQHD